MKAFDQSLVLLYIWLLAIQPRVSGWILQPCLQQHWPLQSENLTQPKDSSSYYQHQKLRILVHAHQIKICLSLWRQLCFVLHLLGNKIRETKMFNNMLLDSAVFHSCGWLCPQKCTVKRKVSPCSTRWLGWCVHIRRCLLSLHTGKGFTLWHHNGIFSPRSCWKTLWAIKPALKLLNAQSGKWGVLGNPAWGWAPLRFCAAFPITKGE